MEVQSRALFDARGNSLGTEVSGDLVFDEGFGDVQSSFENELFQGSVEHQNFKLTLEADPVMAELVAAWRNLDADVWLEVTLESRAQNLPKRKAFTMAQPVKERLVWWGKLVRNEAAGFVDYQSFLTSKGLVRNPTRKVHIGGLEMTFVHWLHVNFSRNASSFLNYYRALHGLAPIDSSNIYASVFSLFYYLIRYISPTKLVGLSDASLIDWQNQPVDSNGISTAFRLDYTFNGDHVLPNHHTNSLFYLLVPRKQFNTTIGQFVYSPLFNSASDTSDHSAGENSLYTRWPTLGDALVTLSREFFLKFDVELPTLREAWEVEDLSFGYDNLKKDLEKRWPSASRWVFCSIDEVPLELTPIPLEKSIKYNPAAVWIKSISITVPTYSDLVDTAVTHEVSQTEGKEISYKTLFRFIGQNLNNRDVLGNPRDDRRGIELSLMDASNLAEKVVATSVSFNRDGSTFSYPTWNQFHVFKNLDLWGGTRAIVEFDHEGTGLELYPLGVRSFGLLNWSDFGNLHYFDAAPGLLYKNSEFGRFSVIEVSRKPGGNTHVRGIERRVISPESIPMIILPEVPDPDDPPTIDPPSRITSFEPLCGVLFLTFGVNAPLGCITKVEYRVDGILKQTSGGFTNLPGGVVTCPPFILDTTILPNGPHQICVTVYPCTGNSVTNCWIFTVTNPCGGMTTPIHL